MAAQFEEVACNLDRLCRRSIRLPEERKRQKRQHGCERLRVSRSFVDEPFEDGDDFVQVRPGEILLLKEPRKDRIQLLERQYPAI